MPGRPPKPKASVNRKEVLDELHADLARYYSTGAREDAEQKTGQRAKPGA
jgi:hypothetical protein